MKRLRYFVPAVLWAALIFFLSSRQSLPSIFATFEGFDKLVHATFYGVLAGWLLYGARGPIGASAFVWAGVASLYGITDELHQAFVPGRSCDPADWVADTLGALLCVALWLRLSRRGSRSARPTA